MKINPPFATRRVLQAAMIVALAATSHPALAANYYWDTTSPIQTLGYGTASGTWGSDSFWSLSNNGTATTGIANPTVGDTLQFGTGSPNGLAEGNITVTGNQTAGNLTFASASGSIGFSGGTIIFAATSNSTTNNSTITVNNVANTISSVITSTGNLTKNGVGNLTLDPGADNISTLGGLRISAGSMVLKSGTMNATIAGAFRLGGSSSPGFTIDGGTLLTRGNTQVGGDVSGGKGLLTINNGTWTNSAGATYLGQGSGGTGTIMTVNGGQVSSANGMEIGTNNTTATLNLNGGTTSVARLFNGNNSTAIVNLNGGTLKANVASGNFTAMSRNGTMTPLNVLAGGAVLDTNGFDISVLSPLVAGSPSGGLTKIGNGTLTLSGNNTYTGVTTLNAGTLAVGTIGDGGVLGNLGQATSEASNLVFAGGGLSYTGGNASSNRNFTLSGTDNTTNTIGVTNAATTLTLNGTSPSIVSTNNSSSGLLQKTGNGHLVLDPGPSGSYSLGSIAAYGGNLTLKSGNISTSGTDPILGNYYMGAGARNGTLNVDGANLTVTGNGARRFVIGAANNGTGKLLSGSITASDVYIGHNGSATMTQSGGDVTTTNLQHVDSGTATYAMTGGNLTVQRIQYYTTATSGNQSFTFSMNGGTVKTAANTTNLFANNTATGGTLQMAVQLGSTNGGATIDTSLSSATIQRPLDNMSGQAGRLTKIGNNTLFLSANNTYTGVTTINAGTLSVTTIGNGGVVGNLGQATADAANLVLAGGSLSYTGGNATSDRNFTLSGTNNTTNTIVVATLGNTLTLTGNLPNTNNGNSGLLQKGGNGNLVLDPGPSGNYTLGSLTANNGSLTLKSGNFTTTGRDMTPLGNSTLYNFAIGAGARGGTLVVDGAKLTVSTGSFLKAGAASNGNLSIVSGTVTAPEIWVGHGGSSVATQSGGDVTTVNLSHADSGSGSYTMTGGNLTVKSIYNSSSGADGTFTFAMNGGTLRAREGTTNLMNTGGNLTRPQLEVQLGNTGATIDTTSSNATIQRPLVNMSGQAGRLTKIGNNTLTLNATNTYTGDTVVSGGTLAVTGSSIVNSGNLVIHSGGKVNLTGDETVNTLFFGATLQPRGTYRASHSSTNFTGSGTLIVTDGPVGDPYSIWANTFLPSNDVSNPDGDNDNDGMTNQQEFAFGLSPINGSSVNPIIAQPDQSSGTFTYQRRADTGLTYKILRSTDLVTWSEDSNAVQSASATDGNGNQTVGVTLTGDKPLTAAKLFVRVAAVAASAQ